MAYVKYNIYFWSPPALTPEQELEIGHQIATHGRDHFRQQAPYLSEKEQRTLATARNYTPAEKVRLWAISIVFFGGCGYVILSNKRLLMMFLVTLAVIGLFTIGSMLYARHRYHAWLDEILAKYAASVANNAVPPVR